MLMSEMKQLYGAQIDTCSKNYEVDPNIIGGIIWQESHGNSKAVSLCGAQGLMQLMPATAKDMGVLNPFDPHQNIEGGTKYFAWLFKGPAGGDYTKAIAAYNAGPARIKGNAWRNLKETRAYVPAVFGWAKMYAKL